MTKGDTVAIGNVRTQDGLEIPSCYILTSLGQEVMAMEQTFEATIEKRDKWYIGWVDAVPGAFSQGRTVREVQENLQEAIQLILETQRDLRDTTPTGRLLRKKIRVQV